MKRAERREANLLRIMEVQRVRGMTVAIEPASRPPPKVHIPRFPKSRAVFRAALRVVFGTIWRWLCRPVLRVLGCFWRSVTICRLFGVPVQFHTTALLYPTGVFLWMHWNGSIRMDFTFPLSLVGIFWFSLLVHEFAHILTARCCGIGTERMIFHPFGAVALLKDFPRMGREFWIAIAGPLGSLALAGIFAFIAWKVQHLTYGLSGLSMRDHRWIHTVSRLCEDAVLLNLFIAALNMIPVYPMDGARVMRSLVAVSLARFTRRTRDEALRVATWVVVRCVAWPLVICLVGYIISRLFSSEDRILGFTMLPDICVAALLLFAGELEYRLLCEADDDAEDEDAVAAS